MHEHEEQYLGQARDILGEHFTNWCIVAVTEDDELYYDYSSFHTIEGLMLKTIREIGKSANMGEEVIIWDEDDNEGEEWRNGESE